MKTHNLVLTVIIAVISSVTSLQSFANSGASANGSAASKHSALALAHGSKTSSQVGSAVIATPLIIIGSIGHVSEQLGTKLMENAISDGPLEITEKTITVSPSPKQMMKTANIKEL